MKKDDENFLVLFLAYPEDCPCRHMMFRLMALIFHGSVITPHGYYTPRAIA